MAFAGRDVTRLDAAARCRLGISRSFQIPHPFAGMTVFENLVVGAAFGGGMAERDAYGKVVEMLRLTGLAPKANVLAGSLTLLERKRLEMARALATSPRLLLLDEIAGGLSEPECRDLIATINALRETGVSIVWIEHVVHALLAVVDRLIVIDFGKKIAEGDPKTVMASREVQRNLSRARGRCLIRCSRSPASTPSTAISRPSSASRSQFSRARCWR